MHLRILIVIHIESIVLHPQVLRFLTQRLRLVPLIGGSRCSRRRELMMQRGQPLVHLVVLVFVVIVIVNHLLLHLG